MKAKLFELIKNKDMNGLEDYLKQGLKTDYLFPIKLGDYSRSVNPLIYSLFNGGPSYEVAHLLFKTLSELEIKDFLSNQEDLISICCSVQDSTIAHRVYKYTNQESKEKISKHIRLCDQPLGLKTNLDMMTKHDELVGIIENDDPVKIKEFLLKNDFFVVENLNKFNYLQLCIKHQAVFCFDEIKENIKNAKSALELKKSPKIKI